MRTMMETRIVRSIALALVLGISAGAISLPFATKPYPAEMISFAVVEELPTHRVGEDDTLQWIAHKYGTTVTAIKEANELGGDQIQKGTELIIPMDEVAAPRVRLTKDEYKLMAQMVHAEAKGESFKGQVAVAAVIINRILDNRFPSTLEGVLFERNAFEPVRNGSLWKAAPAQAYRAVDQALQGEDPSGGAAFFFNPRKTSNRFMHSRRPIVTIGGHRFTH